MSFNEWKKNKFSDFVNINPTISLKGGGDFSFIEMKDLSEGKRYVKPSIERKITGGARYREGNTLFARITPCLENGKIGQAIKLKDGIGFGSTEFLIFEAIQNVSDENFIYYLACWQEVRKFAEQNMIGTSGRQRVNKDAFEKLDLNLPNIPTQKKIASILSSLDDKIELNHRTNQTLEELAQNLFKEMCLPKSDELPEGWRVGKLGDVLTFKNGKSSPVRNGTFQFPVYGANGIIGFSENHNSKKKSIIIGRVGSYCGAVYFTLSKSYVTDNAIIAESKNEFGSMFCFHILQKLNLNNFKVGSGQPLLNQSILSSINIVIPSLRIFSEFENLALPFFEKIDSNIQENQALTTLRDSLLPKLMKGEINIKDL